MERQRARRRLVVTTYALLAMLCGSAFCAHVFYGVGALLPYEVAIYGSMAVGAFVFGGNGWYGGRWGLIKPFANKPPRTEPPMVTLVQLQLQPERLLQADESGWRNDERELERRNDPEDIRVALLVGAALLDATGYGSGLRLCCFPEVRGDSANEVLGSAVEDATSAEIAGGVVLHDVPSDGGSRAVDWA